MSSAGARVFKACRALLEPAKSSASTATVVSKPAKSAAKPKPTPKPKPKAKSSASSPRRTFAKSPGILKAIPVSPALRNFLGVPEASRTDAVKEIWAHVKLHNLQNPADKREIFCDEKLKAIFDGKDKVGFLEVGKLLSRHFVKTG